MTMRLWLTFLFLPSVAFADVIVTRTVTADQLASPSRIGWEGNKACPERIGRPSSEARVKLSVRPEMARRDEPGLSIIVRLDKQRAFVLHHASNIYNELRLPVEPHRLANSFRKLMGDEAGGIFRFETEGEVLETAETAAGQDAVRRAVTVKSELLHRRDVEVLVVPDPELGPAAFEVEALAQAMRTNGEDWLSRVTESDELVLGLRDSTHQPSSMVRYREELTKLETVDLEPTLFEPPAEYEKVRYSGTCFTMF